jgi:transposase
VQAGAGRPSYDELAALVAQQAATIARLEAEVAVLRAENAELTRRLGLNSQNSSKPPSSDSPFVKPAPKSLRRRSGRKPGGQAGHPGSTLAQVADPDEILRYEPGPCGGCGTDLSTAPQVGVERRQVFDLPPIRVRVTEHQLITRRCGCGTSTCAAAPSGISAPVQYGPQIAAIILYLYVGQFLSKKRTAQALAELFGTPVSEGTVSAMTRRAADGLTGFLDTVADRLADAEVVGFDETGLRVAGGLAWVHCARTDRYTLITCHPKRGRAGIDKLRATAEAAPTRNGWHWATQAADALVAIQKLIADPNAAGSAVDPEVLGTQIHAFRCATVIGAAQTRARSTPIMQKHHALAKRLVDRHDDYLRFVHDPRVPADNNGSERDIRMIKLRQKVSGCLRTLTGAQQFCAIRSYLSTAAKHGKHFFHTLVMLAEGHPWLPALP